MSARANPHRANENTSTCGCRWPRMRGTRTHNPRAISLLKVIKSGWAREIIYISGARCRTCVPRLRQGHVYVCVCARDDRSLRVDYEFLRETLSVYTRDDASGRPTTECLRWRAGNRIFRLRIRETARISGASDRPLVAVDYGG